QEADDYIDRMIEAARENGFHMQAAELKADGSLVGLVGIGRIPGPTGDAIPGHPDVEIGWVLAQRFWGQGLAPEGAQAWLEHAWSIGLPEIVAFTAAINTPSQASWKRTAWHAIPLGTSCTRGSPKGIRCAGTSSTGSSTQANGHEA